MEVILRGKFDIISDDDENWQMTCSHFGRWNLWSFMACKSQLTLTDANGTSPALGFASQCQAWLMCSRSRACAIGGSSLMLNEFFDSIIPSKCSHLVVLSFWQCASVWDSRVSTSRCSKICTREKPNKHILWAHTNSVVSKPNLRTTRMDSHKKSFYHIFHDRFCSMHEPSSFSSCVQQLPHGPLSMSMGHPFQVSLKGRRHLTKRETFLVLVKILVKYLECQKLTQLRMDVKELIMECTRRNRMGDPEFMPLQAAVEVRLRLLVGDLLWFRAMLYFESYCRRKGLIPAWA